MHVFDWLNDLGIGGPPVIYDIVEVAFKGGRRGFYKNTQNFDVQTGDFVVVKADRGLDFGSVHLAGELVRMRIKTKGIEDISSFAELERVATLEDIEAWEANKQKETDTFLVGRKTIDKMNLPMKLVDVEWQFDHSKVTFYFTAENRVDFRQLVRDLARRFRTRVELRQIGARDEAARIGGIGSCGRELCCSTWLQDFKPVSTQAAKIQNLPLNPVRLSGQCGRLKCCLNYELEQYMDMLQHFPRQEMKITTSYGTGVIEKLDIFKDRVWIRYKDGTWEDKALAEVREILGVEVGKPMRQFKFKAPGQDNKRRRKPRRKPRKKPNSKDPGASNKGDK